MHRNKLEMFLDNLACC